MKAKQVCVACLITVACFLNANAQKKIYIDCYGSDAGIGWNNADITVDGASMALVDFDDVATGISMVVSNRMTAGTSSVTTNSYTGDALEFLDSGANGAFASVSSWSGNPPCPQAELVFNGLDTNLTYTFTYFASRNNDATGWNRESEYTLTGATTATSYLDAADNFSETAISSPVYPDASGKIALVMKPGPNNNAEVINGRYYFYLNALKIAETPPPAPVVIYIDPATSTGYIDSGWNGLNFLTADDSAGLMTTNDEPSGIYATVITQLAGSNANGSTLPSGDAAEFVPAESNSVYGCNVEFNGSLASNGVMRFQGMNVNVAYTFTMYASRMGVSDTRDAEYIFAGAATNSVVLDSANNSSEVVVVSNVYPDASGVIDFTMKSGPDNDNSYNFFYLSAMKLEYVPVVMQLTGEIYVDTAGSNSGSNWNQIQLTTASSATTLTTSSGGPSGYTITVTDPLNSGYNTSANTTRVGDATEFQPMGSENAYGPGGTTASGIMRLTNLNPASLYSFTFFASRMGVSDIRQALYTVTGAYSGSAVLDAANNISNVCTVVGIRPSSSGEIEIDVERDPADENESQYFYLAVFKISVYEVPGGAPPEIPENAKRLLFFGDQFTIDQDVSGLLRDLAVLAGFEQPFMIIDLAVDADMAEHVDNVENAPEDNVDNPLLPDGDEWDHVIVQGAGTEAVHIGDPLAFKTNAVALYQLIKSDASGKGASAEILLFDTWACSPEHSYYPATFADPAAMQYEIRTNYNAAADMINIAEGAGSARVAGVGNSFEVSDFYYALYEDDHFAESKWGARLAAMILYKALYNQDATNLSYSAAIDTGWTDMSEYDWNNITLWADGVSTPIGDTVSKETIYIDPAFDEAPTTWNIASFVSTQTSLELRNTKTELTGITLSVTNRLHSSSGFGVTPPTGDASEFAPAGNSGSYGNDSIPDCDVLFTGMKPGRTYEFTFYNSRQGATDNRETSFTLTGSSQVSGVLDAASNSSEVLVLEVTVASDGSVLLFIEKGANNDNPDGFYYINAMKIDFDKSTRILLR